MRGLRRRTTSVPATVQLHTRLTDRFRLLRRGSRTVTDRHQALHATMDWSYRLLAPLDQAVLRRLALFTGGWDVSAAEAVCVGGRVPAESVLEVLDELLAPSLVHTYTTGGTPRYGMLETVRHYSLQQLHCWVCRYARPTSPTWITRSRKGTGSSASKQSLTPGRWGRHCQRSKSSNGSMA
jgi:predicted ATPase